MINRKRAITLLSDLIKINSENPNGNEYKIAVFVKRYLEKIGLRPKIYEFCALRSNVVCVLPGENKRSLLITPHLDTVPAGDKWRFPPFKATISGGKLYGLGATDCKVNLAAGLEAINSIVEDGVSLGYGLIFAATADEESGSVLGLEPLLEKKILKPDAALVLDADDFSIVVAQKGLMHLKVKIEGKRAHGAYPWLGVNAVDTAIKIIEKIKSYKFGRTKNDFLKPPTVNIGTIHGGDKVNVVADWCEFELDIRFLPGDSSQKILRDFKKIIRSYAGKSTLEIEGIQEPFSIPRGHFLVGQLINAMESISIKPVIEGSEGATTISFFQKKNIPSAATGFGTGGCAHIADEYVKIDNIYKGAKALELFLKEFKF